MTRLRRKFTREEKLKIVKHSLEPSTTTRGVADQYGVHHATINRWRYWGENSRRTYTEPLH